MSSSSSEIPVADTSSATGAEHPSDVRLTVAQAVVRFLQVQHSRRDGEQQRLIPALFGIFGHGNVAGLSQALFEYGTELPYYQPFNEQSMVHTAAGYAKASNRRATLACSSSIGPGATNMITGAALATINRLPVLLLPSDYYASRRQGPVLQQLEHPISFDESVNDCVQTGEPILRSDLAARPARRVASRGDARADRPGRDRRGHDRPAAGRPIGGLHVACSAVRTENLGARAKASGRIPHPRAAWSFSETRGGRSSSQAVESITPRRGPSSPISRRPSGSRSARRRRAREPSGASRTSSSAASVLRAIPLPARWPGTPTW